MIDASCAHSNVVNSGDTGLNLTKFLQNVEELSPFNHLKSDLRSFNSFRNARATNKSRVGQIHQFGHKLVAMATALEQSQNEWMIINHALPHPTNTENLVKIGPVSEITCLRLNQRQFYLACNTFYHQNDCLRACKSVTYSSNKDVARMKLRNS